MKIRYTETALEEIEDILSYIAKENHDAALKASAAVLATIDRLAEFPLMAVVTDMPGVRVVPALPYRYLIFYSVDDDTLVIRNIRHSARQRLNTTKP
jgi:plasmid stabilization system protein ParE